MKYLLLNNTSDTFIFDSFTFNPSESFEVDDADWIKLTKNADFVKSVRVRNLLLSDGEQVLSEQETLSLLPPPTSAAVLDSEGSPITDNNPFPVKASEKYATFTGTATADSPMLLPSTDMAGYTIAYAQFSATATTGQAGIIFESSNNNSDWALVDFPDLTSAGSVKYDGNRVIAVFDGSVTVDGSFIWKIPFKGRYLRSRLTTPNGTGDPNGDCVVNLNLFVTSNDAYDEDGRVNTAYIRASSGVVFDANQQPMAVSFPVTMASDQPDIKTADISDISGVQGAVSIGNSATPINVSGSNLVGRKTLTAFNNGSQTLYWGYADTVTTSSGTPLAVNQFASWAIGANITVYMIAASSTHNVRVTESA